MPDWGPTELKLKQYLGRPDPVELRDSQWGPIPDVDRAPPFRKEPLVIGQPSTARLVDQILQLAPELRGRSQRILVGPDTNVMNNSKNPSRESTYPYGLLGTHNRETHDISINPLLEDYSINRDLISTLIHELSHSRGYTDNIQYNERDRYIEDPNSAYAVGKVIPPRMEQDLFENLGDHHRAGLGRFDNPWPRR